MKHAKLYRFWDNGKATLGLLAAKGLPTIFTLELSWKDNKPNRSCIPAGTHTCIFNRSPRLHEKLYLLLHVVRRTGIRIHSANWVFQLLGCIAVGLTYGTSKKGLAVWNSRMALRKLHKWAGGKPFELEIIDLTGNE